MEWLECDASTLWNGSSVMPVQDLHKDNNFTYLGSVVGVWQLYRLAQYVQLWY